MSATLRRTRPPTTGPVVRQLQELLNQRGANPRLVTDSIFGDATDRAVRDFQRRHGLEIDGIVGPRTWAALGQSSAASGIAVPGRINPGVPNSPASSTNTGSRPAASSGTATGHDPDDVNTWWYPFAQASRWSHKTGPRYFGAGRSRGRLHAGCDLYFPAGTWIYAVADGVVLYEPQYFYAETYEIAIQHGRRVVRYGEVMPNSWQVRGGQRVQRGQRIAKVGVLISERTGVPMKDSGDVEEYMLHFELYSGTGGGQLTQRSNSPYQRRGDLQNPTQLIDLLLGKYPPA